MRTIRAVRAGVLLFLAAFTALILARVLTSGDGPTALPPPRPAPQVPASIEADGPVETATDTFLFTEERGGVVVTRLSAGRMLGMEGGGRVLSDILIELRPQPETPDRVARISGQAGRFDAAAHEVRLTGEVELHMSSGESLRTDDLRYRLDERLARAPGSIRFELAGGQGEAEGMEADLVHERFALHAGVRLTMAAGEARETTEITADQAEYDGGTGAAVLHGRVTVIGAWGQFVGSRLLLEPMEMSGYTAVSQEAGILTSGQAPITRLQAPQWVFALDGEHGLQAVTARGGAELSGAGDEAAILESLMADEIRLEPARPPLPARLWASGGDAGRLTARLYQGPLEEIRAAELQVEDRAGSRNARFSGAVEGTGPGRWIRAAVLEAGDDRTVRLLGSEGHLARLADGGHTLAAPEITLASDGGGRALGGVEIDAMLGAGRSRVAAVARQASLRPAGDVLLLEGEVRAWQEERALECAWLELRREDGVILAGGGVTASLPGPEARGDGLPLLQRVQVRSAHLRWEQSRQLAVFSEAVHLVRDTAEVRADRLELDTSGHGGTFVARGQVTFTEPRWDGHGDTLTYSGDSGSYFLESHAQLAEIRSRATGSALRGRLLRVDPGQEAVIVDSRAGGRVTVSGSAPRGPR